MRDCQRSTISQCHAACARQARGGDADVTRAGVGGGQVIAEGDHTAQQRDHARNRSGIGQSDVGRIAGLANRQAPQSRSKAPSTGAESAGETVTHRLNRQHAYGFHDQAGSRCHDIGVQCEAACCVARDAVPTQVDTRIELDAGFIGRSDAGQTDGPRSGINRGGVSTVHQDAGAFTCQPGTSTASQCDGP